MNSRWFPVEERAEEILAECVEQFQPRVALSCSFGGPGGMVLIHMLSQLPMKIPVIFLDTDFLFRETVALKEELTRRYDLNTLTYGPELTPDEQANVHGDRLWETEPDRCCHMRKVMPMQQVIEDLQLDAWITALRRDQSATRKNIGFVEYQTQHSGRVVAKVHPLANWSRQDVWAYIHRYKIPYNPLLDQGYSSIGCTHCTTTTSGAERSGRWRGHEKTECGLHTVASEKG